ncbi:MAG: class II aldolase/adducin family protein [Clostridiales bacterium]|nr:class II aldolase/adducin family protein [Clostridiales bacterium]
MLEDLKSALAETAKEAERQGLCKYKSGNFSALHRESGLVAMTPSGVSRGELTRDHIFLTDIEGNVVEKGIVGAPTREIHMHLQAYRCRGDVAAVVHTHSPYATAFAAKGKAIRPVVSEAAMYGCATEVVPYEKPCSAELAASLTAPLQRADVCLLKHHGVLVVGDSLKQTLLKAIYVEDVARIYLYTLQMDGIEPDEIEPDCVD